MENATFIRPVAQNCYDALMLDIWPRPAAIVDFGIDSQAHYAALQYAIRNGATPAQLDAALGDGKAITTLCEAAEGQPYHVEFSTAYDEMSLGAEEGEDEIESDENASEGMEGMDV